MVRMSALHELVRAVRPTRDPAGEDVRRVLNDADGADTTCRLLQLSDLHFGTERAAVNEPLLSAHLRRLAQVTPIRRVILSGDLMDNPDRESALAYRRFHEFLASISNAEPFIVPGNHDQKWMGNLGKKLSELSRFQWSNLAVDDVVRCVLLGFDSSRDAKLARGCVTSEQRADLAIRFEEACARRKEIDGYLKIAVLHHHPYSFETTPDTLLQRMLASVGLTDETFLEMTDASAFLSWCAHRGVELVLHGHKHVPRHVVGAITCETDTGPMTRTLTAVGCGTSLGAESKPLSYNVVSIDPASRRWSVSFFAGRDDGRGFFRQCITPVHR